MDRFNPDNLSNVFLTVLVILTLYVIKSILLVLIHKRVTDTTLFYRTKRVINAIFFFIGAIIFTFIWFHIGDSLITYLGLFSAGLALAMKDILLNIAGWLYILIRQPFVVGDRIEIAGLKGDVIDQNLFKFRILEIGNWVHAEQSTGRIIHVPNSMIFTTPLANDTLGFEYVWEEIRVLVTFESDWRKAKRILEEIINHHAEDFSEEVQKRIHQASKKYMIFYNNLTPIVYTDVVESGVQLTMRFICEPKARRTSTDKIWESVLDRFGEETQIDIAYPTMRRVQI